MEPIDIIATVIGVITTAVAVLGMQFKNMKYILATQIVSNSLLVVQYLLQGTMSGSGVVILGIVQVTIGYVLGRMNKDFPLYLTVIFIIGHTVISIVSYSVPYDVLSLVAAWVFAISMVQKSSSVCRAMTLLNLSLWLVYDFGTGAYSAVLTHAVIIVLTAVAVIRLDREAWKCAVKKIFKKG
ncbi:MAG: YgjV family protein [Clostridia bacterium]|nr:YgjV family protein [Clostridia bacterium]